MLKKYLFTKRLTFKRLMNLCLLTAEYGLKRRRPFSFPLKLTIDPTTVCTMNCVFCSTGEGRLRRKKGGMDLTDFQSLIDECGDYAYTADLFNWGAPFLNPDIFSMIGYAAASGLKVRISSTLTDFKAEYLPALINSGPDELIVSMNGLTKETYEKHHGRNSLEEVKNSIREIAGYRKKSGTRKPRLIWQFMVTRNNEHEMDEARDVYRMLGFDELRFHGLILAGPDYIRKSAKDRKAEYGDWLPSDPEYSRYTAPSGPCHWLWTHSVINWDGSVSPCCGIDDSSLDFGNAFTGGFRAVWRGEKYAAAREALATGKDIPGIICSECARTGFQD